MIVSFLKIVNKKLISKVYLYTKELFISKFINPIENAVRSS